MHILRENILHTIKAHEATKEWLLSFFGEFPHKSLYVVDEDGRLIGLFTKGAFIKQFKCGILSPNTNCKRLLEGSQVQEEAKKIFLENKKIKAVPVTDGEGQLLYELALTPPTPPWGSSALLSEQYRALEEQEGCSLGEYLFWLGYSRVVLFVQFAKEKEFLELESALAKHSVALIPVLSEEAPPDSLPNDLLVYESDLAFLSAGEQNRVACCGTIWWGQLLADAWRYNTRHVPALMKILACWEKQAAWQYFHVVESLCFVNCSALEQPLAELHQKALGRERVQILRIEQAAALGAQVLKRTIRTPVLVGTWHRYHIMGEPPKKSQLWGTIYALNLWCCMDWSSAKKTAARLEKAGVSLLFVDIREVFGTIPLLPQEQERYRGYHFLRELLKDSVDGSRHLQTLWGERGAALVGELSTMDRVLKTTPTLLQEGSGKYVNILGGRRKTCHQPPNGTERQTIYLFGRCYVFGSFCADEETIASYLQEHLESSQPVRRVINCGQSGAYLQEMFSDIAETPFCEGDIVLIVCDRIPSRELAEQHGFSHLSLPSVELPPERPEMFVNGIDHFTGVGNRIIADLLMKALPWERLKPKETAGARQRVLPPLMPPKELESELEHFVTTLSAHRLPDAENKEIGALVMNGNPFTLGHRYLVEYASAACDWLYLFVVEEDRSFFPFQERLALIEADTRDIKNLTVLPSGRCILSLQTMPEYFSKEQDNTQQVDPSSDIGLFAQFIAPALGINRRFVGEEPTDLVTRQYNEGMKAILPQYGIEVTEIPRKELSGTPISASRVRALLQTGDFEEISKLVPETTLRILEEKYRGMGEGESKNA